MKEQFGHSCALCGIQLEIIESAHIIPVREPGSQDQVWNGLALCPNHHSLFDARAYAVLPDLDVKVDGDTVRFLQESDRAGGVAILTDFDNRKIQYPRFWEDRPELRERMQAALERRTVLSGMQ